MEATPIPKNGTPKGNGFRRYERINLNGNDWQKVTPKNGFQSMDFGQFSPRAFYWWPIIAYCLFSFVMSLTAAGKSAAMLGMIGPIKALLMFGVTGGEGIMLAWAFCPQRGLVNKRQISAMAKSIGIILLLQTVEVGLVFSSQLYPEDKSLFVAMGVVAALMGVAALIASKYVISQEERRVTQIEEADIRIETSKNNALIAKMQSRQLLDNKRSIIDVENSVRNQEKSQVLRALNTKESRQLIEQIGTTRAAAVIEAYRQRIEQYSNEILKPQKPQISGKPSLKKSS